MKGDSYSKGREFESQHRILDGHFFTFSCCKICNVVWKDENKWKEAGVGTFLYQQITSAKMSVEICAKITLNINIHRQRLSCCNMKSPKADNNSIGQCAAKMIFYLLFSCSIRYFNNKGSGEAFLRYSSVTRWLDYFFNIWPFTTVKIDPIT